MVFINYAAMQLSAKIVYYGPGLCGKTTSLQYIYRRTADDSRGELVSLDTETDRTLFFDLLPMEVGVIGGFKTKIQLYTVPGQVFYNTTRKLVLRGVDGIVFVADSQEPLFESNVESFNNLQENLRELNLNLEEIPLVFQYNKRDLKNIVGVERLQEALNPKDVPYFETSATTGKGVFDVLKSVSKLTLLSLKSKVLGTAEARPAPRRAAKPAAKPTAKPAAKASAKPTAKPTAKPSAKAAAKPTAKPAAKPAAKPTAGKAPPQRETPKPAIHRATPTAPTRAAAPTPPSAKPSPAKPAVPPASSPMPSMPKKPQSKSGKKRDVGMELDMLTKQFGMGKKKR